MNMDEAAEVVAKNWQAVSTDPEVKAIDWDKLLEFIKELLPIILALFDSCPKDANEVRARAHRWSLAIADDRHRDLAFIERLRCRLWQRRFDRAIGGDLGEELNLRELQVAVLLSVAAASNKDIAGIRAKCERA